MKFAVDFFVRQVSSQPGVPESMELYIIQLREGSRPAEVFLMLIGSKLLLYFVIDLFFKGQGCGGVDGTAPELSRRSPTQGTGEALFATQVWWIFLVCGSWCTGFCRKKVSMQLINFGVLVWPLLGGSDSQRLVAPACWAELCNRKLSDRVGLQAACNGVDSQEPSFLIP